MGGELLCQGGVRRSPLEQQLQDLLGGGEGSVGAQEAGDIGEVAGPEGGHRRFSGFSRGSAVTTLSLRGSSRFRADPFFTRG